MLLLPVVPTTVNNMCRFAVYLSDTLCYVSIDNYVSGVISLNKYFAYDVSHIRLDFVFSTTMKGLRRLLGDPEPRRITLTLENLLNMSLSVDWLNMNEVSMWTCVVLSFRSLLRKCNLVPDNLKLEGHFLRRKSLRFMPWGVLLHISSSKTVQYGQRTHLVPITYAPGSPMCATSLLKKHFDAFPAATPDSPVFMLKQGAKQVPLTYPVLMKYLKRLLKAVNMDLPGSGVHSLRRAGAAFLHQCGVPLEDIRQAGDWVSLTALIYLAKPLSSRIDLDRMVVDALCAKK